MPATIISEFFSSETSGLGYMIKYTLKVGNQKQKTLGILLGAVLLVGSISGYGGNNESPEPTKEEGSKKLDKITLQSLWLPQRQFAGLYVADKK